LLTLTTQPETEIDTYNARGQLVSAYLAGQTAVYTYRPDGLRASKTVEGETVTHVWDGANIIADVTEDYVTRYVRGVNLLFAETAFVKQYYLYNAHGDVVQLTNSAGDVVKEYHYDAFGVEVGGDPYDSNPFRYCAEYFDTETGTIYLRARNYDAGTGRFTSEDTHWGSHNSIYGDDPLKLNANTVVPRVDAIRQSGNMYAYCMGSPLIFVDSTGNETAPVELVPLDWLTAHMNDMVTGYGTRPNTYPMWVMGYYQMFGHYPTEVDMLAYQIGNATIAVNAALTVKNAQYSNPTSWQNTLHTYETFERSLANDKVVGYEKYRYFTNFYGPAGKDMQYHHIVEQCQQYYWRAGFDPVWIYNTENTIVLSVTDHEKVSIFYSEIHREITGTDMRVRDWLNGQSFEDQYNFGLWALKHLGLIS
jgi:RHS repeat-associated protein